MPNALTPQWLSSFESRMRLVGNQAYHRLASSEALTWPAFMKLLPSGGGRREVINWLIDSASMDEAGLRGGLFAYDEITGHKAEYEYEHATRALRLRRDELLDKDGGGIRLAAHWARQKGFEFAYWPQYLGTRALLRGETDLGYDGKALFATDHPLDPSDTSSGLTYANLLTSTASGIYPGAMPIDNSVSLNVAIENVAKVFAYIHQQVMPNGMYPRLISGLRILHPSTMRFRVNQLLSANNIAQVAQIAAALNGGSASAGVGPGDVEGARASLGIEGAKEIVELTTSDLSDAAGAGTDLKSWYVVADTFGEEELGPIVYMQREAFKILYYTGMENDSNGINWQLMRENALEWMTDGRQLVGYGHPYLIYKVKAA